MVPKEVFDSKNMYFGSQNFDGIPTEIGYVKEFRWSWIATQLNTFVFVGEANGLVTRAKFEWFSSQCFDFAIKNHKGWPRGFQAGVGAISILRGHEFDTDAIQFAKSLSKKHWSAFEIPMLYDNSKGKLIRYDSNPIWGRLYFPYFTKLAEEVAGKFSTIV